MTSTVTSGTDEHAGLPVVREQARVVRALPRRRARAQHPSARRAGRRG